MSRFRQSIVELIAQTSSNLPPDVRRAIDSARQSEAPGSQAALALETIAINIDLARDRCRPLCQDTGTPTFLVKTPAGADTLLLSEEIGEAVAEATRSGHLRPNGVDPLTGRSLGDNRGPGLPIVHFEQWLSDRIEVRLLLKGGGCENMSTQYSLPCEVPGMGRADRDLAGVRKCLLHAVHKAQGHGCSVGILGACIGGDRALGYQQAKEQLFRSLDDVNTDPVLYRLEAEVVQSANRLGIGTMGFGGARTLAACKLGAMTRLPASFFVTVAYECWALRRLGVLIDAGTGAITRWLYREPTITAHMAATDRLPLTGREIPLTTPLGERAVRDLRVGDVVLLSGLIHTGRDRLHHHLASHPSPVDLQGAVLYHCGPVALKDYCGWTITAAGPTTSIREEPYEADVIRTFGLRAVVGKGGMGGHTLAALQDRGAVYLCAIGGAAQYYAGCIESVEGVDFLEWGVPEAMWHLRVRDFPCVVTMDSAGNSLHADVEEASGRELAAMAVTTPA